MEKEMIQLIVEIYNQAVGVDTLENNVDPQELDDALTDIVSMCEDFLLQPGAEALVELYGKVHI